MKILLIGPQGSGKSTQASLLAKYLGVPKVSTGDIFREIAKKNSKEGRQIRQIQNEGKLVDDATTAAIVEQRLNEDDTRNGFILDGYPRNIVQKDLFDPEFDQVVYLKVPDEELMKRLLARGREDDTPEGIRTRLDLYYGQTQPLLDYYRDRGLLTEISGMGNVDEIQNEIRAQIKS